MIVLGLSQGHGKTDVSYNQIDDRIYSSGFVEHEYAAGIRYELAPWLRLGIESKCGNVQYCDYFTVTIPVMDG